MADRSALRHIGGRGPGRPVSASTMRAITDFVQGRGLPFGRNSREDCYGSAQRAVKQIREEWHRCVSNVDAPAFSLLKIESSVMANDGLLDLVVTAADLDTERYAVNERYPLYANKPGWVRIVQSGWKYVVRSAQLIEFDDRVESHAGVEAQFGLVGDLVALADSYNSGNGYFTPVAYDPMPSWVGYADETVTKDHSCLVRIGASTVHKRHVWMGFGDITAGDIVFVGRSQGHLGEHGETDLDCKWWGVQRPCPET